MSKYMQWQEVTAYRKHFKNKIIKNIAVPYSIMTPQQRRCDVTLWLVTIDATSLDVMWWRSVVDGKSLWPFCDVTLWLIYEVITVINMLKMRHLENSVSVLFKRFYVWPVFLAVRIFLIIIFHWYEYPNFTETRTRFGFIKIWLLNRMEDSNPNSTYSKEKNPKTSK